MKTPNLSKNSRLIATCPNFESACDLVDDLTSAKDTDFLIEETAQGWQVLHQQGGGNISIKEHSGNHQKALCISLIRRELNAQKHLYQSFKKTMNTQEGNHEITC